MAISVAYADPRSSRYASTNEWCLHDMMLLRTRLPNSILDPPSAPMTPRQLDGFDMSADGLVAIAPKFQQRCSLFLGSVSVTAISGMLSPVQRLSFNAHQARGAAAVFVVGVPTQMSFPAFTDSMFAYIILKRRLLIPLFSAVSSNAMCNVGGCL